MLSSIFGKKPDPKEALREQTRQMKRNEREIERERLALQRQEAKLIAEIKKAAKDGQTSAARTLATNLVRTRKAMARMGAMKGQVQGAATQMKLNSTQANMVQSLAGAAEAMGKMNAAVNPAEMARTMAEFERENQKMDMKQELMDDALDDLFEDDEVDGEADLITQSVLDEIGIDMAGQMAKPAMGGMQKRREAVEEEEGGEVEDDLAARLAALKN